MSTKFRGTPKELPMKAVLTLPLTINTPQPQAKGYLVRSAEITREKDMPEGWQPRRIDFKIGGYFQFLEIADVAMREEEDGTDVLLITFEPAEYDQNSFEDLVEALKDPKQPWRLTNS